MNGGTYLASQEVILTSADLFFLENVVTGHIFAIRTKNSVFDDLVIIEVVFKEFVIHASQVALEACPL